MRRLAASTLFILVTSNATAFGVRDILQSKRVHVTGKGTYSKMTLGGKSLASNAFHPAVDFFVNSRFALEGAYFTMASPTTGETILSGFDMGTKYFLFGPGTDVIHLGPRVLVEYQTSFDIYALLAYRSRTLNLNSSQIGYGGYGAGLGFNWHLGRLLGFPLLRYFHVVGEASQDWLIGEKEKNLYVTNLELGAGVMF